MYNMPDELLIESYFRAVNLKLNPDFIQQLETEIRRRSILRKLKKPS